jgi:hypothetical protein
MFPVHGGHHVPEPSRPRTISSPGIRSPDHIPDDSPSRPVQYEIRRAHAAARPGPGPAEPDPEGLGQPAWVGLGPSLPPGSHAWSPSRPPQAGSYEFEPVLSDIDSEIRVE